MLLFHNPLWTLQLIYIEHKYAVTTQSSAHKVKHTHHSNTKHRERFMNMGLRVHYLHPCFSTKYSIYLIIQIISSLKFPSFSAYAIVVKKSYKFFCICNSYEKKFHRNDNGKSSIFKITFPCLLKKINMGAEEYYS